MSLIKGFITVDNYYKICRICLEEKSAILNLNSIIEFQHIKVDSISIADILTKITSHEGNTDEYDLKLICHDCLEELKVAYLLLLKYEQANSILRNYVKVEQIVDTDSYIDDKAVNETEIHYQTRNATKRVQQTKTHRARKRAVVKNNDVPVTKTVLHSCPICTKDFPALELRDHAHTHKALRKYLNIPANTKVTPTTKFATRRHLQIARETIFDRPNKKHHCPYCNLEFAVQDFRIHIDVHRKQSEFKCDKCERVFKRLNHLNTHRVKHLKEFPYKCDQCGKGFVIKTNYDCHILTHTNDELPHECRFCLKRFSNPEQSQ